MTTNPDMPQNVTKAATATTAENTFTDAQRRVILFGSPAPGAENRGSPKSEKRCAVVEAGAGAGKTKTLVARIERLLALGVPARQILVCSFSRAAATELQERLHLTGMQNVPIVSTIDSFFWNLFCARYVSWRERAQNILSQNTRNETAPHPIIISTTQAQATLLEELAETLQSLRADPKILDFLLGKAFEEKNTQRILNALCSEEFILADAKPLVPGTRFEHPAQRELIATLRQVAQRSHLKRLLAGRVTYLDVTLFLYHTLVLALSPQGFAAQDSGFPQAPALFSGSDPLGQPEELIVDEYQDTNEVQHRILLAICQSGRMVVVGDPKQSIYGFRNAHVGVFQGLKENHLWEHFELKVNFRSRPSLLRELNRLSDLGFDYLKASFPEDFLNHDFARNVVHFRSRSLALEAGRPEDAGSEESNSTGAVTLVGQSLHSKRGDAGGVKARPFQQAVLVEELKKNILTRYAPQDVAIICERNALCADIAACLAQQNIPAVHSANRFRGSDFLAVEKQISFALLRLVTDEHPQNRELFLILTSPLASFSVPEAARICALLQGKKTESETKEHLGSLRVWAKKCGEIVTAARHRAHLHSFAGIQYLKKSFKNAFHEKEENNLKNLFLVSLDHFSENFLNWAEACLTSAWLSAQDLVTDAQPHTGFHPDSAITVTTVHAAKGREWPLVIFIPHRSEPVTPANGFKWGLGQTKNYVLWEGEDRMRPLGLSVCPLAKNPDFEALVDFVKINEKWVSVADMQAQLIQNFESSRVFYTALTRAKDELWIALWASSNAVKKSLRDRLAELKVTDSLLQKCQPKNLADFVLLHYLDEHFPFRKPDKKREDPLEPWLQPLAKAQSIISANAVCYLEYGPASAHSLNLCAPDTTAPELGGQASLKNEILGNNQESNTNPQNSFGQGRRGRVSDVYTRCTQVSDEEPNDARTHFQDWYNSVDYWQEMITATEEKDDTNLLRSPTPDRAVPSNGDVPSQPRNSAHEGILFHAYMEQELGFTEKTLPETFTEKHEVTTKKDDFNQHPTQAVRSSTHTKHPAQQLRQAAVKYRAECEFWALDAVASKGFHLPIPKRRILDVWALLPFGKLPPCFLTAFVHEQIEQRGLTSATLIQVVLDFKSGLPGPNHHSQIQDYVDLVQRADPLCPWVLGILCYQTRTWQTEVQGWLAEDPRCRASLPEVGVALETLGKSI